MCETACTSLKMFSGEDCQVVHSFFYICFHTPDEQCYSIFSAHSESYFMVYRVLKKCSMPSHVSLWNHMS